MEVRWMKLYKPKKEDTLTSIIALVVIIISGTVGVVCAMYDITVFDLVIKLFNVFKTIVYIYIWWYTSPLSSFHNHW